MSGDSSNGSNMSKGKGKASSVGAVGSMAAQLKGAGSQAGNASGSSSKGGAAVAAAAPSSNWMQLQKTLSSTSKPKSNPQQSGSTSASAATTQLSNRQARKEAYRAYQRGRQHSEQQQSGSAVAMSGQGGPEASSSRRPPVSNKDALGVALLPIPEGKDNMLVRDLRDMIGGVGLDRLNDKQKQPGAYLAIDCEMVGTGPDGSESALARVSIVNYHGHIVLDTFVRPRERVTDWRTWVSGVSEEDMWDAVSFEEVQKTVGKLVEGKILVGHAVEHDTKALLLSHPRPLLRDTQTFAALRQIAKTKRPGLKKLAELELGVKIQAGAHSSVTDARATMALYRIHKPQWEQMVRRETEAFHAKTVRKPKTKSSSKSEGDDADEGDDTEDSHGRKRKRASTGAQDNEPEMFPGGGRKGVSSGLGLIVKRRDGQPMMKRNKREEQVQVATVGAGGGGSGDWWAAT